MFGKLTFFHLNKSYKVQYLLPKKFILLKKITCMKSKKIDNMK